MTLTTVHPDMLDSIPNSKLQAGAQSVLVQSVYAETKTHSTANPTTIPNDDSIPQSSEGTEFLTATITPVSGSNYLRVHGTVLCAGNNTPTRLIVAIFRDSGANAVYATTMSVSDASLVTAIPFSFRVSAGSTAATTFKIRAGASSGNFHLNGTSSTRAFGGVAATTLQIDEIKA